MSSSPRSTYLTASLLALLGLAAFAIDLPVARAMLSDACPGELARLLGLAEAFAHGYGVLAILLVVFTLDNRAWRCRVRILVATLGTGALANVGKLLLTRVRPHALLGPGGENRVDGVFDTFGAWLPWLNNSSTHQSIPSGHSAMAAALAVTLVWLYPRGRYVFVGLALLAAGQRIESGAHYVSDALFGAAIGCLLSAHFLHARAFNRFEKP